MSDRERARPAGTPGASGETPEEERLHALFQAAYLPLDPSATLERRVAEAAVEHAARGERRRGSRPPRFLWSAVAAAALLAALGLMGVRWHHGGGTPPPLPTMAQSARPVVPPPQERRRVPERQPGGAPRLRGMIGSRTVPREPAAPLPRAARSGPGTTPAHRPRHSAGAPGGSNALPLPRTHPAPAAAPGPKTQRDDLAFVNSEPEAVARRWAPVPRDEWAEIEARVRRSVPVKDEFVQIPFPRLADASGGQITAAVQQYQREAAVVDARLSREVTLQLKGASLAEVCEQLRAQTGVAFLAGRSVADDKVTIFVEKQPLRQLMRAINHLLSYAWLRGGAPGEYRYTLEQDLRSQLLEEELRNRDRNAALLALDDGMERFRPYLEMAPEGMEKRAAESREVNRLLFNLTFNGGWAGMQLYHRLAPADRADLFAGQELVFRPDAPDPDRRLPEEWQRPILQSWGSTTTDVGGARTRMVDVPGIRVRQVRLKLNRSELGQVSLLVTTSVAWPGQFGYSRSYRDQEVATGRSPAAAHPENARANAALRGQSPFDRIVSLRPEPSCPRLKRGKPAEGSPRLYGVYSASIGDMGQPHVFSGDVWEAVHRETGLPIVADSYTRMHRLDGVTVERKSLFEALCTVADALGVKWQKDGDFLLCRSTGYLWDRLKEVPNRLLQRWSADRDAHGGLPLADLLEMASQPDQQLDSQILSEAIAHCWGLEDWGQLRYPTTRRSARFFATLTPEQQRHAFQPEGVPFKALTAAQQEGAVQLQLAASAAMEREQGESPGIDPAAWNNAAVHAEFASAGWYLWTPPMRIPVAITAIAGRTAAEALAAARRIWPEAPEENVKRMVNGRFYASIWFSFPK